MKKTNNQGFSLVELILAIAILAIIMVALASFMGTTTRTYTRTKNDIEVQEKGQQLYDSIADKMMQATCIRIGTSDGSEYYSYQAKRNMSFQELMMRQRFRKFHISVLLTSGRPVPVNIWQLQIRTIMIVQISSYI